MSSNWTTTSSCMTAPSVEELMKMMESFPQPKKMYLIADDPFVMKPLPLTVFPDAFNEDKDRLASFRVRTRMDYGLKVDPRSAILYTAIADENRKPEPNTLMRIACLAVAIVLFVMIWSTK